MYAISKQFSIQARLAAAMEDYVEIRDGKEDPYCPIGVMIREDYGYEYPQPVGSKVADAIAAPTSEWHRVSQEAREFGNHWDEGYIKDLWDALGLLECAPILSPESRSGPLPHIPHQGEALLEP